MTTQEMEDKINKVLETQDLFKLRSVTAVNHNPHPYMIGPKHIAYANTHYSAYLTEEVCNKVPCAHPGCNLSFDQHTSDMVMFLSILRNGSEDEAQRILHACYEASGVDKVAFVETFEKFRII